MNEAAEAIYWAGVLDALRCKAHPGLCLVGSAPEWAVRGLSDFLDAGRRTRVRNGHVMGTGHIELYNPSPKRHRLVTQHRMEARLDA